MAGGRPPKPVEKKRQLGNPGKRALPPAPSGGMAAATKPPKPLRPLGPDGKRAWARLWKAGLGWLSPSTDIELMQRLCEAYDEREEIREELKYAGRVGRSDKGSPYTHPLVWQLSAIEKTITKYESLCGFTPSDRTRMGLAEVKRVSKLDEFLERQRRRQNEEDGTADDEPINITPDEETDD